MNHPQSVNIDDLLLAVAHASAEQRAALLAALQAPALPPPLPPVDHQELQFILSQATPGRGVDNRGVIVPFLRERRKRLDVAAAGAAAATLAEVIRDADLGEHLPEDQWRPIVLEARARLAKAEADRRAEVLRLDREHAKRAEEERARAIEAAKARELREAARRAAAASAPPNEVA